MSDLRFGHYFEGGFNVENMRWALMTPLKNGTQILIRDRFEPNVWLSGIYEMKRWPHEESSMHAGIHVKESWLTSPRWRPILDGDEVKLA